MGNFPNLARHICDDGRAPDYKPQLLPGAEDTIKEVTNIIIEELVAAGMPREFNPNKGDCIYDLSLRDVELLRLSNGYFPEVPTGVKGFFHHWKFERRWYYYSAEGAGIPPEFAIPFDKEWGKVVRVNGDCACRGAEFWGEGFAISSYHIDTPEGLKAFIDLLKGIYKPHPRE